MLWRRPPQIRLIPQTAPVPDAEALRRAVLQASWRRDRWVARRRVWLRWLVWVTGRYLMPALLVFGLGAATTVAILEVRWLAGGTNFFGWTMNLKVTESSFHKQNSSLNVRML